MPEILRESIVSLVDHDSGLDFLGVIGVTTSFFGFCKFSIKNFKVHSRAE